MPCSIDSERSVSDEAQSHRIAHLELNSHTILMRGTVVDETVILRESILAPSAMEVFNAL